MNPHEDFERGSLPSFNMSSPSAFNWNSPTALIGSSPMAFPNTFAPHFNNPPPEFAFGAQPAHFATRSVLLVNARKYDFAGRRCW